MLVAALLLLPLVICAPTDGTNVLEFLSDITSCLRTCYGANDLVTEKKDRNCLRSVDHRTLWDNSNEWTYEGPTCGVYTTLLSTNLSIYLPSLKQHVLDLNLRVTSDGAYTACGRACINLDITQHHTCDNGQSEFGLISMGISEGVNWVTFQGARCLAIMTIITTYEEGIPIVIGDDDVALNLTVVDGEMRVEETKMTAPPHEDEDEGEGEGEDDSDSKSSEKENDDDGEDEEYVEKLGERTLCAKKCLEMEKRESNTTRLELRAVNHGGSAEGGWYSRHTFDGPHEIFTTLIQHDANTKIRMGHEVDDEKEVRFQEEVADCLTECYDDEEFQAAVQQCSEYSLHPAWSIVDHGIGTEGNYFFVTLAIPDNGCHSLSTFVLNVRDDFEPIRIVYGREEQEIFTIEDERAISYDIHETNSPLLGKEKS